jgi:hypothetical protein
MASRTITDRGVNDAAVTFEKATGGPLTCEVLVRDSAGIQHNVRVPITGTLTAGEAAALPGVLLKLYNAALGQLGFQ